MRSFGVDVMAAGFGLGARAGRRLLFRLPTYSGSVPGGPYFGVYLAMFMRFYGVDGMEWERRQNWSRNLVDINQGVF
jgi:hypothetical protein